MLTKPAKRAYDMARHYRRQSRWATGKVCRICRTSERLCPHHVDPDTKDCQHIWSLSEARLQVELAKCIPLCKPCHDWLHSFVKSIARPLPAHGTEARYARKCRCDDCKAVHAARNREYRNRKKEAPHDTL